MTAALPEKLAAPLPKLGETAVNTTPLLVNRLPAIALATATSFLTATEISAFTVQLLSRAVKSILVLRFWLTIAMDASLPGENCRVL